MTKQEKIMYRNAPKSIRKWLVDRKHPKNRQSYAIIDYLVPKPSGYVGI